MTSEPQELNDFTCAIANWLAGAKDIDLFRDLQQQSVNIFMKYRDNPFFNSTLNLFRQVLDDPEFQEFERQEQEANSILNDPDFIVPLKVDQSEIVPIKKNKHKSKKERKAAKRKSEEID